MKNILQDKNERNVARHKFYSPIYGIFIRDNIFSFQFEASDDKPKPPKEESNEATPNLSRRNTIVMPPTFQEVEPDMEPEEGTFN